MTAIALTDEAAYFDRLAEVEADHWWSRGMWRLASFWLDHALRGRRGLNALDLGCGTGMNVARLTRRPEIAEVLGIDVSARALKWAARHTSLRLRASALALPCSSESFDLVICFDVFQHLPAGTEPRAARELLRVLRPGGFALVRANGRGWTSAAPQHCPAYRLADLVQLLAGAGLVVCRATYANCLPSLAQDLRARLGLVFAHGRQHAARYRHGLRIALPPAPLNELLGGVSAGEAIVAGHWNWRLPFGHSTFVLAKRVQ